MFPWRAGELEGFASTGIKRGSDEEDGREAQVDEVDHRWVMLIRRHDDHYSDLAELMAELWASKKR